MRIYYRLFLVIFVIFLDEGSATSKYDHYSSLASYSRKSKDIPRKIIKIYHYDNYTDCQEVCMIPCETAYVIHNDVSERRQFTCKQRKPPTVASFISFYTTRTLTLAILAALGFLLISLLCCCCCCGWLKCDCCCRSNGSSRSSNDPLVNGEFKEILDSKDIGYLRKESLKRIITV